MTAMIDLPAAQLAAYTPDDRITEPGVYEMSAQAYHDDPVPGGSLSSTGARALLAPSCPAKFHYERTHGRAPKNVFDIGSGAHRIVLGKGADIVDIDADDYRTKAAQDQRDAAYRDGLIPLLPKERRLCESMATVAFEHPLAGPMFTNPDAQVEKSMFWQDERTGVWCRSRPDWFTYSSDLDRLVIVDYKSCKSAEPDAISRAVYEYGYHQQDDFYSRAVKALGLAKDAAFVFVFQEKTPPYLVTVVELDFTTLQIGAARNDHAIRLFKECSASGTWPGYTDEIAYLSLPAWAERSESEVWLERP